MSEQEQLDSPPLTHEEIECLKECKKHPEEYRRGSIDDLLKELHSDV